ncbi:hypothetical protein C8D03_2463 [Bosea sp. 124]|nr:hypothetical protein C8D03_2463 [Bosea sp. 124]
MAMAPSWSHQVEMKVDRQTAPERLRRIESWCAEWQIGFRVRDPMATESIVRVAFEDPRFARAFHSHFGGVMVPVDEIEHAMTADARDEDK